MLNIRQGSTEKVLIGPVVAVGDGFTPITTLALSTADEAEVILHNNATVVDISGYTMAAITGADGYYHLTLQSGISNTVGHMSVVINDDSLCLPVRQDFMVMEEAAYDALYASGAPGPATPQDAGVIGSGTAQSATSTTLVLAAGETFANDEIIGATILITGGSTGVGQARKITDYVGSTDTATVDTWTTTPTGTITYKVFGTPDAGALTTDQDTKLSAINTASAAIKVVTDALPNAGALTDISSAITTIDTVVDAILIDTDSTLNGLITDVKTVTDLLSASAGTIVSGAAAAGTLSTTQMTTNLTEATDDHYNGRMIIWTSGVLQNQATAITDYTGASKLLTFTAVTEAPTAADTFIIV